MRRHHVFFPSRTPALQARPGDGRVMIAARPAEAGMGAFAAFPDARRAA